MMIYDNVMQEDAMTASVLSVRVDADVKESFANLCEELGMTASVAVNMFVRQMLREGSLPFVPSLVSEREDAHVLDRETISRAVAAAAIKHEGIKSVILFGSYARGEATAQSDIDLRVLMDERERTGLFAISSFADEVREATGCHVDVLTASDLREDVAEAIEQEGVTIYERP